MSFHPPKKENICLKHYKIEEGKEVRELKRYLLTSGKYYGERRAMEAV